MPSNRTRDAPRELGCRKEIGTGLFLDQLDRYKAVKNEGVDVRNPLPATSPLTSPLNPTPLLLEMEKSWRGGRLFPNRVHCSNSG